MTEPGASDWRAFVAIAVLGAVSYAMRIGGYLAAGTLSEKGLAARLLRIAPGNLFAAFVAAGCLHGGLPSLAGAAAALGAMVATRREWAALAAGFAAAALTTLGFR